VVGWGGGGWEINRAAVQWKRGDRGEDLRVYMTEETPSLRSSKRASKAERLFENGDFLLGTDYLPCI
jgi:hypothetical protein